MRLTRAGEYAIRCILYLSFKGQGILVSKKEIAAKCAIPPQFLSKIAQELQKARILEIKQGPKGGFVLTSDPDKLTLLDVVEAIIGEIYLNDCIARPSQCSASAMCAVHQVWGKARNELRRTLDSVTFKELSKDPACIPNFEADTEQ